MSNRKKVPPRPKRRIHVVREGDTLRKIAYKYYGNDLEIEKIMKANSLATQFLRIGKELYIP